MKIYFHTYLTICQAAGNAQLHESNRSFTISADKTTLRHAVILRWLCGMWADRKLPDEMFLRYQSYHCKVGVCKAITNNLLNGA